MTQGRVQLRRYTPLPHAVGRSAFQLFNFYLVSGGESEANSNIIKSLLSFDASVPTFVCGDLNFIEKDSDTTSSKRTPPTQIFLDVWATFRSHFNVVDVDHDAHTYYHIMHSNPTSPYSWSSRLDRFLARPLCARTPFLILSLTSPTTPPTSLWAPPGPPLL